jgi:hypothetical protein
MAKKKPPHSIARVEGPKHKLVISPPHSIEKDKPKHKRRYCRIEGCNKVVKSQGLCQRHGAKPCLCKIKGCTKQAQGSYEGMCKTHFKHCNLKQDDSKVTATTRKEPIRLEEASKPSGESVYDRIIPESLAWSADKGTAMPLIEHLKEGFIQQRPRGWHRNDERHARGLAATNNPTEQLKDWERQLVWSEICLLSGSPQASFHHLARSWGRNKGFQGVVTQYVCERRGDVQRKRRVDTRGEENKMA